MTRFSGILHSPSWSAWSQTFETQHVIALMKPASEQMHFGSRLQELGIAFNVQFFYGKDVSRVLRSHWDWGLKAEQSFV